LVSLGVSSGVSEWSPFRVSLVVFVRYLLVFLSFWGGAFPSASVLVVFWVLALFSWGVVLLDLVIAPFCCGRGVGILSWPAGWLVFPFPLGVGAVFAGGPCK
jgi:hypothetical protein